MVVDANSHDTIKVLNNETTSEDVQFSPSLFAMKQTHQKINKDDSSPVDGNHTSNKGHLSPIQPYDLNLSNKLTKYIKQKIDKDGSLDGKHTSVKGHLSPIRPSCDLNISNKITIGPDEVRVETVFLAEGASNLFQGTETSVTRKTRFGLTKVAGMMNTGDTRVITGSPSPGTDVSPVSTLEEGTLSKPLLSPVVEGTKMEILKSIVYGGLIESITSLGVISSAAGSGASTLRILVLGFANLFGGLILIIQNLQELKDDEHERIITEDNQTNSEEVESRYKQVLGRIENFKIHALVAILSFIIVGLVPPIVYYFSFSKTHNREYKVATVFLSSLLCIVLLAIVKAHVQTPRGSYFKSVLYYVMTAVPVSGVSYVVGKLVYQLLERHKLSNVSETPVGQHMMLSLLGRKAGSFGYSSSY